MQDKSANFFLQHSELITRSTNITMRRGAFLCALMGYSASAVIYLMQITGFISLMEIPLIWALCGATISVFVYILAWRDMIRGMYRYIVTVFFISMPTTLFIAAHFLLPSGAATYISGPASYIYFFFIVLTGFFFNARLSIFAGLLAALQYSAAFFIDRGYLDQMRHPDAMLLQDFTSSSIYMFKGQMMLFSGIAMAVLARHMRKLTGDILREEQEKQAIDRVFGQYVSKEIKEKILSRTEEAAGEKKNVVILFSDIRSFSSISEGLAPELTVRQLNEYLDCMVRCINENGGVIDKFIGDAVMAVFGGVLELENPCEAALQASLAMQRELQLMNRKWWEESLPPFSTGIGLHYGEVLQGSIGSKNRKEFTVIGDAVNTASRIESLTKDYPYPILISREIFDRLSEEFQSKAVFLGEVAVKGKSKEVSLYGVRE